MSVRFSAAWLVGGFLLAAAMLPAQNRTGSSDLATGRFLVAKRGLSDPNFAESVVLLARYGAGGAMGLIINRQTTASLAKLKDDLDPGKNAKDPVYSGGPVGRNGVQALLRSEKPADAPEVVADVYLISSRALLDKHVQAGVRGHVLRVYLGYAGWAPGQLEREVESGAWHILKADADAIFDPDPDSLWSRLIRRTELRFAILR